METSRTTTRYNRKKQIQLVVRDRINSPATHEVGVIRQHFVNGNHRMQLIRQMQQKYVPEYTSFVFKMTAKVLGNFECSVACFMEDFPRYESLCNKFSKDYKNKQEVQYDSGRSREKVLEHSLKLRVMAAKVEEGPVGFWNGYRAFCRRLCKSRVARTAHRPQNTLFMFHLLHLSLPQSELFSPLIYRLNPIYAFCVFVHPFTFVEQH